MKLSLEQVCFSYKKDSPVLENISLEINSGEVTALMGANAAGKSTLLKCIFGLLGYQGKIKHQGEDLNGLTQRERTELFGYLPQDTSFQVMLTVFEAVLLGRLQSLSWKVTDENLEKVRDIMEQLDIFGLAPRYLNELSGGQKQMVSIAQTVIREPQVLLLDEPTNGLDLQHQLEIMDFFKRITHKNRITIVALHDLNLALKYANNLVVFQKGKVYASGKPETIITSDLIREIYGVNALVNKVQGIIQVVPISSINACH